MRPIEYPVPPLQVRSVRIRVVVIDLITEPLPVLSEAVADLPCVSHVKRETISGLQGLFHVHPHHPVVLRERVGHEEFRRGSFYHRVVPVYDHKSQVKSRERAHQDLRHPLRPVPVVAEIL